MTAPTNATVLKALVADTFRQSIAARIFWLLLGVSALCILLCLSVQVRDDVAIHRDGERPDFLPRGDKDAARAARDGVDVVSGDLSIAFGAIRIPLPRDRSNAVHFLKLVLAGFVADTVGILLTLVWTAAFLPSFLEPNSLAVVLAKPVSRRLLTIGKFLGVLCFVAAHAALFVCGTYCALGIRTGDWDLTYLLAIPLLLLHFAAFFGFSMLLAMVTRSTIVCIFGTLVFWCVCWGMNYGRHSAAVAALAAPEGSFAPGLLKLIEIGYWILPKPADLGMVLFDALGARGSFSTFPVFEAVRQQNLFHPIWSIAASLAFSLVSLIAAMQQFEATDY